MDEPLSNLDAKLRIRVRAELKEIQRVLGITTVYVTHDQDEALSLSDQVAVMAEGRLQQYSDPWTLYQAPVNRFVADFVGYANVCQGRSSGASTASPPCSSRHAARSASAASTQPAVRRTAARYA
jgi:ABC-type Fe3+/spermidine/putrescine transport system ATPase subunit